MDVDIKLPGVIFLNGEQRLCFPPKCLHEVLSNDALQRAFANLASPELHWQQQI